MSSLTSSMKKMASVAQKSVQKQQLVKTITERFIMLLTNVKEVYNDNNFETIINVTLMIKKTNPKMIISLWNNYISSKYYNQLINKDLNFVVQHDIMSDFRNNSDNYFNKSTLDTGENLLSSLRFIITEKYNKEQEYTNTINKLVDECVIITKLCELYNTL